MSLLLSLLNVDSISTNPSKSACTVQANQFIFISVIISFKNFFTKVISVDEAKLI